MAELRIDISEIVNRAVDKLIESGWRPSEWIPCSDRLPEKQGRYLVSSESGQITIQKFLFSLTYGVEPYFSGCEKVIAWMPMPDAYEPPEVKQE